MMKLSASADRPCCLLKIPQEGRSAVPEEKMQIQSMNLCGTTHWLTPLGVHAALQGGGGGGACCTSGGCGENVYLPVRASGLDRVFAYLWT